MSLAITWSAAERAAWAPPEDITVSQWAEKHRVLPKQCAIPGLWNNHLVPYAVGAMDAFNDSMVERITIMASVPSAETRAPIILGLTISQDPAPALVVMPTDKTLKRVNKRLQDMIMESPELRRYLTGNPGYDKQKRLIMLQRMEIHFATAGGELGPGERGGPLHPVG